MSLDGLVYDGSDSGLRLKVDKSTGYVCIAANSTRPPTAVTTSFIAARSALLAATVEELTRLCPRPIVDEMICHLQFSADPLLPLKLPLTF